MKKYTWSLPEALKVMSYWKARYCYLLGAGFGFKRCPWLGRARDVQDGSLDLEVPNPEICLLTPNVLLRSI